MKFKVHCHDPRELKWWDIFLAFPLELMTYQKLNQKLQSLNFSSQTIILESFHMEQDRTCTLVSEVGALYRLKALCMSSGLAADLNR